MFEPFAPAIDAFAKRLARNYRELFGRTEPDHVPVLRATARLALERIAATDALYHDALHTLFVADVGQAILRGRAMVEPVSRESWLHLTVATLLHDIGYLRGVCPGDGDGRYAVDAAGKTVAAPRGATDAFLAPGTPSEASCYVRRRWPRCRARPRAAVPGHPAARFPVPEDRDHAEGESEAGLVRAADLIGQLADPAYPRRLAALVREFRETGAASCSATGPADLAGGPRAPGARWSRYIGPALRHLERTADGRLWVAQLYAHVFVEEHVRHRLGTERGPGAGGELRVAAGGAEPAGEAAGPAVGPGRPPPEATLDEGGPSAPRDRTQSTYITV